MTADNLGSFNVVHIGSNDHVDTVSVCMGMYHQLAEGIIEKNAMMHVSFRAVLEGKISITHGKHSPLVVPLE